MFSWENPIRSEPGLIRDPFVIRVDDAWFLTGSAPPFWSGPVDGLRLWRSEDLQNWHEVGTLIERADIPESAWYRDRLWAPEIHRTDDGFYLTFNGRNDVTGHKHSVALAFSRDVTGPYEILTPDEPLVMPADAERYGDLDGNRYLANDGCLFTSPHGEHFVAYSSGRGIHGQQVDLRTARRIGDEFVIAEPDPSAWNAHIEGPSIVQIGGTVVCFFSSYTRGYEVGIMSAPDIRGPWTADDRNPVMGARGPVKAAGHTGWFDGPDGRVWLSYHVESEQLERERMAIDPITVDAGGRVVVDAPTWGPQISD